MFYGFVGLVLTYIILFTMFLWMLRKSDIKQWKKLFVIPLTLWWAIALYYTPLGFMGYPVSKDIPDKAIIVSYKIIEPNEESEGGMYFWVIDVNNVKPLPSDPRKAFQILNRQEPRAYKLPYNKNLHKDISKKKKEQKKQNGVMIWSKTKTKEKIFLPEENEKYDSGFQIINPLSLLPSKDNPE